jgi:hypothetical protein
MDSCIIFPNPDGGVSICYPMEPARGEVEVTPAGFIFLTDPPMQTPAIMRPETDEEFLLRIAHKDVPPGLPFKFIPVADIPSDRSQRPLWGADFSNPDGIAGQP